MNYLWAFLIGGALCVVGQLLIDYTKLTPARILVMYVIAGVIFVCGLGFSEGITFTICGTSITLTALAIAAIAGILLNAILPGNDYEFGKNPDGDKSRGVYVSNTDNK